MPRSLYRLAGPDSSSKSASDGLPKSVLDSTLGESASLSLPSSGTDGEEIVHGLARTLSASGPLPGDLCGPGVVQGDLLSCGQLALSGQNDRTGAKTIIPISPIVRSKRCGAIPYVGILENTSVRSEVKKRVKKDNLVSREELLALLERVEARSLQEGDGQILKAVIEKTFRVRHLHWEGKITKAGPAIDPAFVILGNLTHLKSGIFSNIIG